MQNTTTTTDREKTSRILRDLDESIMHAQALTCLLSRALVSKIWTGKDDLFLEDHMIMPMEGMYISKLAISINEQLAEKMEAAFDELLDVEIPDSETIPTATFLSMPASELPKPGRGRKSSS